ncbi:MAG: HEAT repeat domain-containing protein [Planctomycetota bacterium]
MESRPPPPALALLAGERNRAADAALLEALPDLESHARSAAVEILVRRAHAPTLAALVLRFGDYDEDLKSVVSRRIGGLHAATRAAIVSPTVEDRAGAIELIRDSGEGKLAYLLADAVRSTCRRTRELAAGALHGMTARMLDRLNTQPSPTDASVVNAQADGLAEAIRTAVQRWELHFQPKVLEAALWMAERVEAAVLEKLREPQSKIVHVLSEMIEGASDPRLAGAVLRALAVPPLRPAAARAITHARNPLFIRALARRCWLLADREIEHGCRWVYEGPWVDDWLGEVRELADSETAGVVRFLGAIGGPQEKRMERFRTLLDTRGDEVRRAVLWQVIDDPDKPATDLLTMIAARTGDEIAEIAARECRRRHRETPARPGICGQGIAEGHVRAANAFAAFFEGFDRLTPVERTKLAAELKDGVADLAGHIRARCVSASPIERCRAVRVAKVLGVLDEIAQEVQQLAHDGEAVVRSTAVGVLSDLPGPTTTRILRDAVNDPDARVQANAVEALDRLNVEDRLPYIKAKLSSPHSRVRANAVRALLRVELREAGEVLLDMLEDPSQAHRLSALWVIERMRLRSVLHRIVELSHSDPDERVRQRAQRVFRDLGAQVAPRVGSPAATAGRSVGQVGSA